MFVLPQPSPSLDVSMPGAATSSFSAADHAKRTAPPVHNIGCKAMIDVAPILNSQPPEEGWSGKTSRHPPAWPCCRAAEAERRTQACCACSAYARPGRISQEGANIQITCSIRRSTSLQYKSIRKFSRTFLIFHAHHPVLPTAPVLFPTSSGHFFLVALQAEKPKGLTT